MITGFYGCIYLYQYHLPGLAGYGLIWMRHHLLIHTAPILVSIDKLLHTTTSLSYSMRVCTLSALKRLGWKLACFECTWKGPVSSTLKTSPFQGARFKCTWTWPISLSALNRCIFQGARFKCTWIRSVSSALEMGPLKCASFECTWTDRPVSSALETGPLKRAPFECTWNMPFSSALETI